MTRTTKPSKALFFVILLSFLLNSCVTGFANKRITEENGAIPPDLGNGETTMFFITHHRSYNKYLKRNVEKIYKGDYQFIEHVKLIDQSDKYDDKDKYRYVFNYEYVDGGTSAVNR